MSTEIEYNPVRVICPQCQGKGRWPETEDYPDDCPMCSGEMTILLVPVPLGARFDRLPSWQQSDAEKIFDEAVRNEAIKKESETP